MAYESLVEGEGAVHLVEGCVDVSRAGWQIVEVALKTSVELLDIADAYTTTGGRVETVIAGELKIDGVLESLPFWVGE